MSVDSVSLRFSVAAGGLLLPLAGAVAGRFPELGLGPVFSFESELAGGTVTGS